MSKGSILLVDDDLHVLKSTASWLKEIGFTVTEVAKLSTAQDAIHRSRFDVVVSDIRLEDGEGFELLAESQKLDYALPVILFTGYGTLDTAVEAIRQGAFDFLSKPLMDDELLSAIERAVALSPSQQAGDQARHQANQQQIGRAHV